jgi:hypothetical protein
MIEIQHVRITFESVPLDEGRAGAIVTRALEILERQCATNRRWHGAGQDVIVPPVVLDFVGSNDTLLSQRVAAALREELDRQFPPESDRAPQSSQPGRGGFHSVPLISTENGDRVESVPAGLDCRFMARAAVATPHPVGREGRSESK